MLSSAAFILYLILPNCVWLFRKRLTHSKLQFVVLFFITIVLGYVLYVGGIWILDKELKQAVDRFDLDHDGGFSDTEYTPEAQAAMKEFTSDTGRTFAPFVAGPITIIWVSFCFSILAFISWIRFTLQTHAAEQDAAANP
jgi:hypothetical protein